MEKLLEGLNSHYANIDLEKFLFALVITDLRYFG